MTEAIFTEKLEEFIPIQRKKYFSPPAFKTTLPLKKVEEEVPDQQRTKFGVIFKKEEVKEVKEKPAPV